MTAAPIEAITGVKAIVPTGPVSNWIAFAANTIGLFGATLAILLTLLGARAALNKIPATEGRQSLTKSES